MSNKEYWWISVGGNRCEPSVKDKNGAVYTIGCPDPLSPESFIFVSKFFESPPKTPVEEEKARIAFEKRYEEDKKKGIIHGYRNFD